MADQPSIADSLQPAPQMSGGMTPNLPLTQPLQLDNRVGRMRPMAQAIQSQGRGNDSMLVHMTPGEVSGLNALAMQTAGRPLTINPQTGLPEAGILETILPIAAGFALGPAGFAMMSAPMAALTVGGLTTLATGDLGKGLMAGLGAYGGAGLGETLAGAGASGAEAAASNLGTVESLNAAALEQAAAAGSAEAAAAVNAGMTQPLSAIATGPGSQAAMLAEQGAGFGAEGLNLLRDSAAYAGTQTAPIAFSAPMTQTQLAMSGVKNLGTGQGWSNLGSAAAENWAKQGTMGKAATAIGLAAPVAQAMQPAPMEFPTGDEGYQMNYEGPYLPTERRVTYPGQDRTSTSEYQYFTPSNPIPYAEGGDVEDRAIRMPGAGYQAGTNPEFNYNFRAVDVPFSREVLQGGINAGVRELGADFASQLGGSNSNMLRRLAAAMPDMFERLGNQAASQMASGVPSISDLRYNPETQRMERFAEGGETEDRGIKFAGADYKGGIDPEFGHGFKPVQVQGVDFGNNVASAGNAVPEFFSGKGGKTQVANPIVGYTSSGEKIYQYGSEADYLEANPFGLFGGKGGRMDSGNNTLGTVMGRALSGITRKKSDSDADLSSYTNLQELKYNPETQRMEYMADGGEVRMEDGGFVMDARSVSEIGNGSSNAGLEKLSKLGARPLQGRGDGVSDSIPANIGGSQKARVARDEAYFSPAAVEKLGGSQKLYAMMDKAHKSRKNAKRGQDTGGLKALMA